MTDRGPPGAPRAAGTPSPGELAGLIALVRAGRHAELERPARELLARYPHAGFLWKVLGVSLWTQGKPALGALERAAALLPDDAEAHMNLGGFLRAHGSLHAAAASYARAAALTPGDADLQDRLGNVLFELGEFGAATECCRRALEREPRRANQHANLAMLLMVQNRPVEAEESCRRALELDPALTGALVMLAELAAARGEFAQGEQLLGRALTLDRDLPEAWAALGRWRRSSQTDAEWLREAQRVLALPLPPRRQVALRYALGKYFDELGDFTQAFASYRYANELTKLHSPRYERGQLALEIERLTLSYDRDWLRGAAGRGHDSERPVFIVGMWRSGTTLAEQILASHPAVHGAGEVPFWKAAAARYEQAVAAGRPARDALGTLAGEYLAQLAGPAGDAPRVIDKMSANFLHLGLIHAALPHARIIHMRRDPIDTCLSIYFQDFAHGHPYAHDLADLAHYYRQYLRVMQHWRQTLPAEAMLEVSYEALVRDQEPVSRGMLAFLGLPWDARCLDFHHTARTVMTSSKWQVRQALNRSSVARWHNYREFIAPLLPLADPT